MLAKIKTIALVILGLIVLGLTVGLWDPFEMRKPKEPDTTKEDQEDEREKEKAKTDAVIYEDLAELGSVSGDKRDNALLDLLDKDYPGK